MQLQEQQVWLLVVTSAALVGMLAGYLLNQWFRHRERRGMLDQQARLQQDLEQAWSDLNHRTTHIAVAEQRIESLGGQLRDKQSELNSLREHAQQLQRELHRATTDTELMRVEQQKERQHTEEKLRQLELSREQLKKEFEVLAQQILKSTQQEFSQQNREKLDDFLRPFRQQISDFRSKVETIHSDDLKQREALKTELKHLQDLNIQITREAHQLSTALKGQKKTQGNWGELILENVLDRSGLQLGKDYDREVSFNTDSGRKRPDVVVYLPDDKHLVIDAKVSLNAYTRYVNAEDELQRAQALREHISAVSERINELSDKHYFDLPGLKSPEIVFMFIPIESAFVEAIRHDESLFQAAIARQVLVATPTTLLTSLNIVRQLWRFEDQNRHAAKLSQQAAKVYNQLRLFVESMRSLGEQLDRSRRTYDEAMNRFMSGRGNLVKRVEDFQKLGVSVQNELPREIVDKARLELDLIEHSAPGDD